MCVNMKTMYFKSLVYSANVCFQGCIDAAVVIDVMKNKKKRKAFFRIKGQYLTAMLLYWNVQMQKSVLSENYLKNPRCLLLLGETLL